MLRALVATHRRRLLYFEEMSKCIVHSDKSMANAEHLEILKQGVNIWNQWRDANRGNRPDRYKSHDGTSIRPDLTSADLRGMDLCGLDFSDAFLRHSDLSAANLSRANLAYAHLRAANLTAANLTQTNLINSQCGGANFAKANLTEAELGRADLVGANLSEANLTKAELNLANLAEANLTRAICRGSDLNGATLIRTILDGADLTGAHVYGMSAWDLKLTPDTVQHELIITDDDAGSKITVDDIQVAQFIYLLLNNDRLRSIINTITSKVVLILGRFTPERKAVLDSVREELGKRNYLPIVFDFEKPSNRDLTETVSTLAHMAKFIIADLTDAKSLPQELGRIIPFLPSVPVQPLLLAQDREYAMFESFTRYPWVLDIVRYATPAQLLRNLTELVITPAERMLASTKSQ